MTETPDIRAGRLTAADYAANFADAHPPLDRHNALIESARCYFCFDAPCVTACPTTIDIPSFIRKIATGNLKGSARDILEQNIMGAVCARVCPTEVLCEGACVRNLAEHRPVTIGALQRHAVDHVLDNGSQLFSRAAESGRRVAVIGGGPAGLACAHRLARAGHAVTVFEARDKLGGLNEYGVASYKVTDAIAAREVDYILAIGGIDVRLGVALGRDIGLAALRRDFDAVFLGLGLGGVNALGLEAEAMEGVLDAVDYIARLRQADDLATLPVGRRVVVVGGGMTAIDIACQTRRLGAEEVSIVYRRGPEKMKASEVERDFAQTGGVVIRHWARPHRLIAENGRLRAIEFERTRLDGDGRPSGTGETYSLAADMLFKAIGQVFVSGALDGVAEALALDHGRIAVDADRRTSLSNVWAGGDCVAGGEDLTVAAVADGRIAGDAIDRALRAGGGTPAKEARHG